MAFFMELKQYQQHSLDWLRRYYRRCRALTEAGDAFPAATAFTSVTGELYEGAGLPYAPVKQVPGIPYVCLRIPTGGGKTLVACESIAVAVRELFQADRKLVLWLVPSDAIRTQTLARLKDDADPYRQALDTALGHVAVLDIEEATRMKRPLLDSHTVIVVATMQAFRRRDMSGLNVYKNNGELMSHFENLPPEVLALVERDGEDGYFPQSLVNVFRTRRPFVIVDEAHNARQPLSFETLRRLNPGAVLELTATPNLKAQMVKDEGETIENPPSNVLYSVSAYALKAEEMIKLPIYLRYREPWDSLLGDAIGFLNHLAAEARAEEAATGEYLRPIMLLQAQSNTGPASITVDAVEARLREFGVEPEEICVHTGDRRGLDGVNVLTRECRVRFIITVQALKEGWDCPWASVLFSVAEMTSGKAVEQILGRVLRMPQAQRKQRGDLNHAYAYVASTKFAEAANALKDGLVAAGFEKQDAEELVIERPLLPRHEDPPPPSQPVVAELSSKPAAALPLDVIDVVTWDEEKKRLTVEKPLTPEQEQSLLTWAGTAKAKEAPKVQAAVQAAVAERAGRGAQKAELSPAERGVEFAVPVLALRQGDFLHQFEEDDLSEGEAWSLSECDAALPGFTVPREERGIVIDVTEREKLQQRFIEEADRQQRLLDVTKAWPAAKLINWLDRSFAHPSLTEAETLIWLNRVLAELEQAGHTLEQLTAHRHRLAKAVAARVSELQKTARRRLYVSMLFGDGSGAVHVSLASVFKFDPEKYPVSQRYQGLPLPRHFYKEIGAMNSQEEDCARLIAHDERVACWVRNLEREPRCSFWIQTATDKFYPDFVAKLTSGKLLAIEYKGAHLADTEDTKEKERLGKLWEERSGGLCFFEMVKGPGELAKVPATISRAAR